MCSQFTQRFKPGELLETLGMIKDLGILAGPQAIMPHMSALAIVSKDGTLCAEQMQFGLLPRWSKEPKVKFATFNARLETISEKASFKDAFLKRHCIVPMTSFTEPIYENILAGNMVAFQAQLPLFAASIWEEWTDKKSGEVITSFSVITSEPLALVQKTGHDRSPVFLEPKNAMAWLQPTGTTNEEFSSFLLNSRFEPSLTTSIDRPMRPDWEKRRK